MKNSWTGGEAACPVETLAQFIPSAARDRWSGRATDPSLTLGINFDRTKPSFPVFLPT
jgi:hypothetical protein